MLSDRQLALMRAKVQDMMPDTVIIKTRAYSGDGAGGWGGTATVSSPAGTIAARMDPVPLREYDQIFGERPVNRVIMRLSCPYDAVIAVGNIITYDGDDYEVLHLHDNQSARVAVRALVGLIK